MNMLRSLVLCAALLVSGQAFAQYIHAKHEFTQSAKQSAPVTVVVASESNLNLSLPSWSAETTAMVNNALKAKSFTGKAGEWVEVLAPAGLKTSRLIVVGVGESTAFTRVEAELLGAKLQQSLPAKDAPEVTVVMHLLGNAEGSPKLAAAIAHGFDLRSYSFDRYKSAKKTIEKQNLSWVVQNNDAAKKHYADFRALAEGIFVARDITNLPGSDGYPKAIAEFAAKVAKPLGIKVTILGPEQVKKMGMGSLYSVSQGSQHKAHMLALHWEGSKDQPIALVGKGNTFDTGGYNLKTTSASILRMQTDKAGGAAVIGTVLALAGQKAPVNVVAVVPLSHNLVSSTATLPGDVVTAGDGTTIEVANTDAEGRLILADGIWYARHTYKPSVIVDIATLTGSKVRALGTEFSAVFSEHDDLISSVRAAGQETGEIVWQLPLGPYPGIISSNLADIKNTGSPGAQAGAIFLQHFAKDTPWVHIDMAGNAFGSAKGIHPNGGNGYGVRLLTEWVKLHSAKN